MFHLLTDHHCSAFFQSCLLSTWPHWLLRRRRIFETFICRVSSLADPVSFSRQLAGRPRLSRTIFGLGFPGDVNRHRVKGPPIIATQEAFAPLGSGQRPPPTPQIRGAGVWAKFEYRPMITRPLCRHRESHPVFDLHLFATCAGLGTPM